MTEIKTMRTLTGEIVTLVWACAWCPRNTWQKLKPNEDYTHGICKKHFKKLKYETHNNKRIQRIFKR